MGSPSNDRPGPDQETPTRQETPSQETPTSPDTPASQDTPASPVRTSPNATAPAEGTPVTVKLGRERRRRRRPGEEPRPDDTPVIPYTPRKTAETPLDPGVEPLADTVHAAPDSMPISDPKSWDRYQILRLLGKGGMGAVYEAKDRRLGRHVAIKFIHTADPLTTARFLREARAQARIDHPNVCKVLEVGEVEGKAYIAMHLVRGVSLTQAARTMSLDDKVRLMRTVAEAVHAAHRLGIIHRDLKPANIMVESGEGAEEPKAWRPVLMDFGLAREAGDNKGLTESGAVMGTPAYMPPEQARGDVRRIDARSDVYSLGATLYHVLSGAPPFTDDSAVNIILKVIAQEPVPLRTKEPSVPLALDTVVGKCLRKEPHLRYATAAELADDLERYLNREKVVARRLSLPARLYWLGRRNRSMAIAIVALIASLTAFAGYGVRTVIVSARAEATARRRAELGQKLGQSVKDLEWLVRSAYLVPLHDTSREKAGVRARMAEIEADMRSFGNLGAGLDHYALGRGHFALGEWGAARVELSQAVTLGVREPELDYALGRVLGELYSAALDEARRSGDKSYFQKQKVEIDREYLAPALAHLERCRGLPSIPASYLEGLIHFYRGRYDEALESARSARAQIPWLYEAAELEGDVFMARALDGKDRGESDQADLDFAQAVAHYDSAADIGRSDALVHEAIAEAWIRQEEMDLNRGRDPRPKLEKALAAADKALIAAPADSHGHTKKAFAYNFEARYAQSHGAPREEVERLRRAQIAAGEQAIAMHPGDALAREITGVAYAKLAEYLLELGQPVQALLDSAFAHLEQAIAQNPRFPWAYNDYGLALAFAGYQKKLHNERPEELFEKAIEMTKKAVQIDDQYLMAYNSASSFLTELADWKAEHGGDPEKAAREAVQMADRAIQINKKNPLPHANAGLAIARIASYELDTGQDGREAARQAVDRFKAVLAIDPNFVFAQRELGRAYGLLARHELALGLDPRASIDLGLGALEQCYRTEPGSVECKAVEAELQAALAEAPGPRAAASPQPLEQAQKLASEAAQKLPDRADLWLVLGQIDLQWADAPPGGPKPPAAAAVVEEGLKAVENALARAPGMPRALAVQGALSLHQAQIDPAREKEALTRARASFSQAFAANPLLRRRHEKAFAEVERRSGGK